MALAAFRKAESAEAQVLILGNMHARRDRLADLGTALLPRLHRAHYSYLICYTLMV